MKSTLLYTLPRMTQQHLEGLFDLLPQGDDRAKRHLLTAIREYEDFYRQTVVRQYGDGVPVYTTTTRQQRSLPEPIGMVSLSEVHEERWNSSGIMRYYADVHGAIYRAKVYDGAKHAVKEWDILPPYYVAYRAAQRFVTNGYASAYGLVYSAKLMVATMRLQSTTPRRILAS